MFHVFPVSHYQPKPDCHKSARIRMPKRIAKIWAENLRNDNVEIMLNKHNQGNSFIITFSLFLRIYSGVTENLPFVEYR